MRTSLNSNHSDLFGSFELFNKTRYYLNFCTYFDQNYLPRGWVLLQSLRQHCPDFRLYVLCLDEFTYSCLQAQQMAEVIPLRLSELEANDPELVACKQNRSMVEYYFTLSPCLPLYLLERDNLAVICSLDADMCFYQNPLPLFEAFQDYSILISEHNHSHPVFQQEQKTGRFNVSFQAWRNDSTGLACLRRWREQCIDWCGHYCDEENGRYADQKYLETWPVDYPGKVYIIRPVVAGLATWNVNNVQLSKRDGVVLADGMPVVFYHFHGLKLLYKRLIDNAFCWHDTRCTTVLKNDLYAPYLRRLDEAARFFQLPAEPDTTLTKAIKAAIGAKTVFFYTRQVIVYLDFSWLHRWRDFFRQKTTLWPRLRSQPALPKVQDTSAN